MRAIITESFIRIVLVCLILISITFVFAQFAGGSGTDADPYLVQTAAQLDSVRYYLGSNFRQIADIDLDIAPYNLGTGWNPIAGNPYENNSFCGRYNGAGYHITNLLHTGTAGMIGLFASTSNAVLDSINITDCSISCSSCSGALVGIALNTTIWNCTATGNITSSGTSQGGLIGLCNDSDISGCSFQGYLYTTDSEDTGGLIGQNVDSGVSRCFTNVNIHIHSDVLVPNSIGGLIGCNTGNSQIEFCNTTGSIVADTLSEIVGGLIGATYSTQPIRSCFADVNTTGFEKVGGLIGISGQNTLENCYATGNVTGVYIVGGFIGYCYGTVSNCYSTGLVESYSSYRTGGFIGYNNTASVNACYWDTQTSGQSSSSGGVGRTTDDMTYPYSANTYADWDFINVWRADSTGAINSGYPYLSMEPITVNNDNQEIPVTKIMMSNYPNPFNPMINISFNLPKASRITLRVYNLKGQLICTLADNYLSKGEHTFQWEGKTDNGKTASSGMYIYKLKGNGFELTRKMTLMK